MKNNWTKNLHLKKGELKALGYSSKVNTTLRHKALQKAIKKYGLKDVILKINVIANLNINRPSGIIFKRDLNYLKRLKR
jgi:hypothetical protein